MFQTYDALVIDKDNNQFNISVKPLSCTLLKEGEVRIRVHYSSINYKDCLACTEDGKIIRQYPHVPGIDLSGEVIETADARYQLGDKVIATSYDIGVSHFGGFSQIATLQADWLVPLPQTLTLREAMIIGTAGLTAAISITKLEQNGLQRGNKRVVVTGATGGVGSLAIAMLHTLGYQTVACTRKVDADKYLKSIGASEVLSHHELLGEKIRALDTQQYDGAVDAVGGNTLAAIVSKLKYGASVAVSGVTGGAAFESTVFPFILRAVNIVGIDSVYFPLEQRIQLWNKIANEMKPSCLNMIVTQEIALNDIPDAVETILSGQHQGRYMINLIN